MDVLQRRDFDALAAHRSANCVSVYMPTYRNGSDALQNPLRLKNLLREVEAELVERGMRSPQARDLLERAQRLQQDAAFWRSASEGLALFFDENSLRAYRVPHAFADFAATGPRFHVKPLLPLVVPEGRFLVLAVSANRVRLLEGSRWQVAPIDLAALPANLVEALNYDQPEEVRQVHTAGPGTRYKMDLAFHGQGGAVDAAKTEVTEYFIRIDRALQRFLANEKAPLVFAGVDSLFPIYQEVNRYPHLQPANVGGNTDLASDAQLHKRAWEIVAPLFAREAEAALARCREVDGSALGTHELLGVLKAAHAGAVASLLVDVGRQQWGAFDAETGNLYLHDVRRPESEELVDLAVSLVASKRGDVYPARPDQLSGDAGLMAAFRYPIPSAAPAMSAAR